MTSAGKPPRKSLTPRKGGQRLDLYLHRMLDEEEIDLAFIQRAADAARGRAPAPPEIDRIMQRRGRRYHADLLFVLSGRYFPFVTAKQHWNGILAHAMTLEAALGRDPGLSVVALDYLTNIAEVLNDPQVIDAGRLEQIAERAVRDPLTQLYDRRTFEAAFQRELRGIARYGITVSLLMLDLDDFKQINDTHGHPEGDRVLCLFARLLQRQLRDVDLACRFGGEEFAVMLPHTNLDDALLAAERIRRRVDSAYDLADVTVSIGVAAGPRHGETRDALVAAADDALYRAKSAGKNCVRFAEG